MSARAAAVAYFVVQAIGVAAWWAMLLALPPTRDAFAIHGAPYSSLAAFALGDLGVIAVGSLIVAMRNSRGWAVHLAWLVSGAMLYGTCYVVVAALVGTAASLGALLMLPASVASISASVILSRDAHADLLSSGSAA